VPSAGVAAGKTGKSVEETESAESARGKAFNKDADDGQADEIDKSKESDGKHRQRRGGERRVRGR